MNKKEMARKIAAEVLGTVQDFDMEHLIRKSPLLKYMGEAARGEVDIMPSYTLRGKNHQGLPLMVLPKQYSPEFLAKLQSPLQGRAVESNDNSDYVHAMGFPLIDEPKYQGDFLDKLRGTQCDDGYLPHKRNHWPYIEPGIVAPCESAPEGVALPHQAASEENLWDFSMPSEMLKHQEQPHVRTILDGFYGINRPGDGAGSDTLEGYWNRGWEHNEAPYWSEDTISRPNDTGDLPMFRQARQVLAHDEGEVYRMDAPIYDEDMPPSSLAHRVLASALLEDFPLELELDGDPSNTRTAMLISDFANTKIRTKEKGVRKPDTSGVIVRLRKSNPASAQWSFETSSGKDVYSTIFQFIPHGNVRDTSKLHVRCSCSCPSWVFWGAQWNALRKKYLYGKVRLKATPPSKRDPNGTFLVCKHVLACLPLVSTYKTRGVSLQTRRRLVRKPRIEIEKKPFTEKIRIPAELRNFGFQPEIKQISKNWETMSPREREKVISGMTSAGAVAYMGHRFPETATKYVIERLNDLSDTASMPSMRKWAERLMAFWVGGPTQMPKVETEKLVTMPSRVEPLPGEHRMPSRIDKGPSVVQPAIKMARRIASEFLKGKA